MAGNELFRHIYVDNQAREIRLWIVYRYYFTNSNLTAYLLCILSLLLYCELTGIAVLGPSTKMGSVRLTNCEVPKDIPLG